ncbi:MAG TPA: hypothetical protein ENI86_06840 [Acidimicrobiales bacterium]|nr:hypothetical protein [Acidimicrobiales bacterium]
MPSRRTRLVMVHPRLGISILLFFLIGAVFMGWGALYGVDTESRVIASIMTAVNLLMMLGIFLHGTLLVGPKGVKRAYQIRKRIPARSIETIAFVEDRTVHWLNATTRDGTDHRLGHWTFILLVDPFIDGDRARVVARIRKHLQKTPGADQINYPNIDQLENRPPPERLNDRPPSVLWNDPRWVTLTLLTTTTGVGFLIAAPTGHLILAYLLLLPGFTTAALTARKRATPLKTPPHEQTTQPPPPPPT